MTRLGIVGLGRIIEKVHWPILSKLTDSFSIEAVCDHDAETLEKWRSRVRSVRTYSNYEELVADPGLDAVLVTTPVSMNAIVAAAALKAGKDVFLEKPMAVRSSDASALEKAIRDSGKRLFVLEQLVFGTRIERIREILNDNRLGKPVYFEQVVHFYLAPGGDPSDYGNSLWRISPDFPLGLIMDGGIHDIAVIEALFGLPKSAWASGGSYRPNMGPYDHILSVFKYENGLVGSYSHSAFLTGSGNHFNISCTEGDLIISNRCLMLNYKNGRKETVELPDEDLELVMWNALCEQVASGGAPTYGYAQGIKALSMLEAVERSLNNGQTELLS